MEIYKLKPVLDPKEIERPLLNQGGEEKTQRFISSYLAKLRIRQANQTNYLQKKLRKTATYR